MKQSNFSKKRLSATISMLLGATALSPVMAQEADDTAAASNVEIIQVSGIRGSLARSQDIKRESSGIVDAISAEEMGKFPDTNLAESLQRITGVTISRSNNEGSKITVRGFGPNFNLLTLNGRQMPGTSDGDGISRSFDLSNLASTGVSALEVYKSSRADVPSGGLGATVDILTAKPLSSPGLKYTFSAKGIYDTSNELGDDVTPELAALYSQTFLDNKIGISVATSYQERDFQQQAANIPGWLMNQGPFPAATNVVDARADATTAEEDVDPRYEGGIAQSADGKIGDTFFPRQLSYDVRDIQRSRVNTHTTFQFAPRDDMTFTMDYMYNQSETSTEGYGFGIWFNFGGNVTNYELDENGTATRFTEVQNDYAHSRTAQTVEVIQDSIGFNWEWQINDDFHVELDYHDSSVDFDNGLDEGTNASSLLIIAPNNIVTKTYDFTSGEIPQFTMTWPNGAAEASPGDIDPLFAQFGRAIADVGVEQFQIDGKWENPNDSFLIQVRAGAAYTDQKFKQRLGFSGNQGPNGFNGNQAIFPDAMFTRTDTGDLLDEFSGGGASLATNYYFDWDLGEALSRLDAFFPDFTSDPFNAGGQITEGTIQEETTSAYVTAKMEFELGERILDVNVGVRWEETDVLSTTLQRAEDFLVWSNPTEWQLRFREGDDVFVSGDGNYDVLLPSLDLRLEVQEDIFARFSLGKTIARSSLSSMSAGRSLSANPKPGSRTGTSGNPNLTPFESVNMDISVEWYYDEASYVSIAYYKKDVKDFVVNGARTLQFDGLRDPFIGPRATTAISQLEAEGIQPTVTAIWDRIIANGGGVDDPCCQTQIVRQQDDDPLVDWFVNQPVNDPAEKSVDGIEFAVQHMFADTGFGASFNFTVVDSDSEYDPENRLEVQSPLTDISDSANFQVFYEDDYWSVKVTNTWRDDYLIGVGQDQGTADGPPQFFKDVSVVDFSVNYSHDENLTLFLEGFNITNETEVGYGRYENQFLFGRQYGPRYAFGIRYTFE